VAAETDLVIGLGTRFQDFTTGSWTVFSHPGRKLVSINLHGYDALKHGAVGLVADARQAILAIDKGLGDKVYGDQDKGRRAAWFDATDALCAAPNHDDLPTDAQVIGAVQRQAQDNTVAMCAAGSMPGYLQVLWRAAPGGYHMEYGYSCMGYEVAGAMGIKLADPSKEVICFVGDGSYMMANSELATAVMRRVPFTIVLTDNRGYGCINRLQMSCGGAEFNNLYASSNVAAQPEIDFVAHAGSMGAHAEKAANIAELEAKIVAARTRDIPTVIVIDTTPYPDREEGGHWWDVAVPEVSERRDVNEAREKYVGMTTKQAIN
jgi:3D-(3,5/4)-trihydroxycyclohexane-1,2-dione acylhydrolase (decyclizing)